MTKDNTTKDEHANNLLHGIKLVDILERLVDEYGWEQLGDKINIRCFNYDPSIKSSLKFLRRTPWARDQVEDLYVELISYEKKYNAIENK